MSGEAVRKLPCGHVFHRECINAWFEREDYDVQEAINMIENI